MTEAVPHVPFQPPAALAITWLLAALCLSLLLQGCATHRPSAAVLEAPAAGYSGMAQLDPTTYLVAHDVKSAAPRFGLLHVAGNAPPQYEPLDTADWPSPEHRASDVEAVCALPDGGLLAAESGPSPGREGRMFSFTLIGKDVRLRWTLPLPTDAAHPHNFEGMACMPRRDGKVLLLLGERGGSESYPQGLLYWGLFDQVAGTLVWAPSGRAGTAVNPPRLWNNARETRAIADLYLDAKGELWAVATEDGGNDGPFRSLVYRAASVQPARNPPVRIYPQPRAAWIIDGLKVEALAGPAAAIAGSVLSFATDDEHYGGIWRPLYYSLTDEDGKPGEAIPMAYRAAGKGLER